MARITKTLQRKVNKEIGHGFGHRDHRSKKGRKFKEKNLPQFKLKKEKLYFDSLE